MGLDCQSGIVEEDHSDLADYYEDDDCVEDDDTINGLTFPEMRAVLQRLSDGTISDSQRGEAAMLMLGMAGGKRMSIRSILLFLIPDARSSTSPSALSINHRSRMESSGGYCKGTAGSEAGDFVRTCGSSEITLANEN